MSDLAEHERSGTDLSKGAPPPDASPPPPRRRQPWFVWAVGIAGIVFFLVGLVGMPFEGKLGEVQKNDNAAWLPGSAESTKVDTESQKFQSIATIPGFVVYERDGGLTDADKAKITEDLAKFAEIPGIAADQITQPQFSKDDSVATVTVPLIGKDGEEEVDGEQLGETEDAVIDTAREGAPDGLEVLPAGPGGLLVAFVEVFGALDGQLLLAAGVVVILILLVVYRSPVLWFYPLFSSLLALGASALVIYPLAKNEWLTLNGQSQGILSVVVIGAGTDYALLLVSRYREELHNHARSLDAMVTAWKGAAPAIAASGTTVILGLLCLALGELNSNKSLGPVCAIGIACTVLIMLFFLPVFLLSAALPGRLLGLVVRRFRGASGRWLFWPRIPRFDQRADVSTHGAWARFAEGVSRRRRLGWVSTAALLLVCVAFLPFLRTEGLSTMDSFTSEPDAIVGQKLYDANFDAGAGAPAVITASADKADEVIAAAAKVPGVATGPGAICVQPDYAKISQLIASGAISPADLGGAGCAPEQLQVQPIDGRIIIDANIVYRYDTDEADATVQRIRDAVHAVPGADAMVGGSTAINHDVLAASRHDRNLVIPIVLVVIMIVLGALLRALVAPLLLMLTVVLSFAASLGVSALMFNYVFDFANADPAFPLFAFVFLVALGIDYNIFLMTRVREETLVHGTQSGITRGLSVTGGVITSAGIVLAATFAVLAVLPLVSLAQVGFTVAFGVLLDTIIVRSILVPALSHEIGKKIWWPSKLAKTAD
ncbi:MMPL family transporter [Frankia sp. CNm7]|uniref:MMPL family transporter n=1 Tax=Frankia nepalensis TaxID=1836974 RepID=A0A937R9B2_9ACTN|nr:MMPL family transporter [Frankia nepalensis]MBL7497070.1 MMPL family transporter [Frankia nepalensis]MBL7514816.1 MMPL family transporter [Frankia nepalensis]MBL7518869.1 MMPL family transporter [Frankia nepalensis]MBL7628053.1 MMPL family transporter [Frankia nepalensis]